MTRSPDAWSSLFGQIVADPAASRTFSVRNSTPSYVFWGVLALLALGILHKVARWLLGRQAVGRLEGDRPDLGAITEAAKHGRAGLVDLFRLLSAGKDEAVRQAAGHALSVLWKEDELVPEEEKALVTRGFEVKWRARRRYPRALNRPIPIVAEFGVPFLNEDSGGIGPSSLEWSARILGSERVSLEKFSEWNSGAGRIAFDVDPRDLTMNGPHRRVLHATTRTVGLTATWELDLPQVPFTFEFDSTLAPGALLGSKDEARAEVFASATRLAILAADEGVGTFAPLNSDFAIRGQPFLGLSDNLPADLAHSVVLEIEGVVGSIRAGAVVAIRERPASVLELRIEGNAPDHAIATNGERRIRAVLTPDVHRGWCDPDVRSIWPGEIATPWVNVAIVRL